MADQAVKQIEIELPAVVTVRSFADSLNLPVAKVISKLLELGVKATINESIDFETAQIAAEELGFKVVAKQAVGQTLPVTSAKAKPRPPIVTVMGHVDHGKTQLLDKIRQTNLVAKEAGGITQSIGAYQVKVDKRDVTFLDTPGHEAFAVLRAHGASITDIVVLVVAADEGVKPQTIEAISHAKAAGVPIIVAINKMDLPNADPEKVKRQLAEHNILSEDYGGKIPTVPVSASTGQGIKELLELILLVADLSAVKADPRAPGQGVVVESHVQAGIGPVASCLPTQGSLQVGEIIVIGPTWGKIRTMTDWQGNKIEKAGPATPIQISGLKALPHFADIFQVVESEREARELAGQSLQLRMVHRLSKLPAQESEQPLGELKIILKADVVGSIESLKQAVSHLAIPGVKITIINAAVGQVNETEVNLADTTAAVILAFRTEAPAPVKKLAQLKGVTLRSYQVIYQLLDDLKDLATGKLEARTVERQVGRFEVIKPFFQIRAEAVIGGKVVEGNLKPGVEARVLRADEMIGKIRISSIKQNQATVDQAIKGKEYGLKVAKLAGEPFRIKAADSLDCYVIERIQPKTKKE